MHHKSCLAISSWVGDPDNLYLLTIWTVVVKKDSGKRTDYKTVASWLKPKRTTVVLLAQGSAVLKE